MYTDTTNLLLHVTVMSHGRHLDICLESIGICLLKFLQLCGPCQRTYNVDIDAIGTPLGSCDSGQSADAFLGRCISALSEITEETCAGGKVNNGTLGLLQVRSRPSYSRMLHTDRNIPPGQTARWYDLRWLHRKRKPGHC